MATNSSATPHKDPLEEASDPATDTERLRYLANHKREDVRLAAIQNPGVPEDVWRKALLEGLPEAWSNPMAPIYLLVWSPQPGDQSTLESAIRRAAYPLIWNHNRCSPNGKVLLSDHIMRWWAASVSALDMMDFLMCKENFSDDDKSLVRILVLCARTMHDLPSKDRQALDLLDAWCAGGEDRRVEAQSLASLSYVKMIVELSQGSPWRDPCSFVKRMVEFSQGYPWINPCSIISDMIEKAAVGKEGTERDKAKDAQNRLLADLIRKEMTLPPPLW